MIVAIAGGALQGMEMTYLAGKAGFETLLLDRRGDAPATGICHRFVAMDLTDPEALTRVLKTVDLVLPATENAQALRSLVARCGETSTPLAFDPGAYSISSSKATSDELFRDLGIPAPRPWPGCAFPVLAKPDGESGSRGVEVFHDLPALEARFGTTPPPGRVVQEYLAGPAYSIEVVGRPGDYTPLQVTRLEMARDFACKRVVAPSGLPPHLLRRFEEMAVTLAEAVALTGIMDVEAILHEGQLKVLEIDARFPSQTPMAVYHSTGVNMVEGLARMFSSSAGRVPTPLPAQPPRGALLEHVRFCRGHLDVCGEHIMAAAGPLRLERGFFGADEALTNHAPGREAWVATLVVGGSDPDDARKRRDRVVREIRDRCGVRSYADESPLGQPGPMP